MAAGAAAAVRGGLEQQHGAHGRVRQPRGAGRGHSDGAKQDGRCGRTDARMAEPGRKQRAGGGTERG